MPTIFHQYRYSSDLYFLCEFFLLLMMSESAQWSAFVSLSSYGKKYYSFFLSQTVWTRLANNCDNNFVELYPYMQTLADFEDHTHQAKLKVWFILRLLQVQTFVSVVNRFLKAEAGSALNNWCAFNEDNWPFLESAKIATIYVHSGFFLDCCSQPNVGLWNCAW